MPSVATASRLKFCFKPSEVGGPTTVTWVVLVYFLWLELECSGKGRTDHISDLSGATGIACSRLECS
jgi:hypothetical protein